MAKSSAYAKRAYRSLNQAAVQAERASRRSGELIIAYTGTLH
jgi:hypothetical protein